MIIFALLIWLAYIRYLIIILLVILKIFQIHIKFDALQNIAFTKIPITYLVNENRTLFEFL